MIACSPINESNIDALAFVYPNSQTSLHRQYHKPDCKDQTLCWCRQGEHSQCRKSFQWSTQRRPTREDRLCCKEVGSGSAWSTSKEDARANCGGKGACAGCQRFDFLSLCHGRRDIAYRERCFSTDTILLLLPVL